MDGVFKLVMPAVLIYPVDCLCFRGCVFSFMDDAVICRWTLSMIWWYHNLVDDWVGKLLQNPLVCSNDAIFTNFRLVSSTFWSCVATPIVTCCKFTLVLSAALPWRGVSFRRGSNHSAGCTSRERSYSKPDRNEDELEYKWWDFPRYC